MKLPLPFWNPKVFRRCLSKKQVFSERLKGDGTVQPTQGQNIIYFRIFERLVVHGHSRIRGRQ